MNTLAAVAILAPATAVYYLYAREYNRAAHHLTKALEVQPGSLMVRFYRGLARFLGGHREMGEKEMRESYGRMSASTQAAAMRNVGRVVRNQAARTVVLQTIREEATEEQRIVRSARLLRRHVEDRTAKTVLSTGS